MSNVVQFLEALARNPTPMSAAEFSATVTGADLKLAEQQALLERDPETLNRLLGGRAKMMCAIVPAENDDPPEQEEEQEGDLPEKEVSSPQLS